MSETCQCGEAVEPAEATIDLQGLTLCPECAAASAVPCAICGREVPVRIYAADGHPDPTGEEIHLVRRDGSVFVTDDLTGIEDYVAVCRECDNPEGVMR